MPCIQGRTILIHFVSSNEESSIWRASSKNRYFVKQTPKRILPRSSPRSTVIYPMCLPNLQFLHPLINPIQQPSTLSGSSAQKVWQRSRNVWFFLSFFVVPFLFLPTLLSNICMPIDSWSWPPPLWNMPSHKKKAAASLLCNLETNQTCQPWEVIINCVAIALIIWKRAYSFFFNVSCRAFGKTSYHRQACQLPLSYYLAPKNFFFLFFLPKLKSLL